MAFSTSRLIEIGTEAKNKSQKFAVKHCDAPVVGSFLATSNFLKKNRL